MQLNSKSSNKLSRFSLPSSNPSKEARRLVIEAKGIAEANRIKGESVTPTLVSWEFVQGIKTNPNVLYVPIGSGGGNVLLNLPAPALNS